MAAGVEIVVGTYEEFVLGYKIDKSSESKLVQSFATRAHTGSVRSVTSMGSLLVSGGADDKIIIYDLKTRTESRMLMHHDGTVNCVAFAGEGSHLLSGGGDGALTITTTGNWKTEKTWPKAHQGSPVTGIAVHPTSKLALSIGEDGTLRTWNLVKGRKAYVINLGNKTKSHPSSVVWGPEGQHFSITGYNDITVWAISNAAVKHVLKCPSKSVCMVWISEELTVVGLENGQIMLFNIESGKTATIDGHSQRIKSMAYDDGYLYTASSSGHIKVWKMKINKMSLSEKYSVSTGCRITCLCLVKPLFENVKVEENDEQIQEPQETEIIADEPKKAKKKRKLDDGHDERSSYSPYVSVTVEDDSQPSNENKKRKHSNKSPK